MILNCLAFGNIYQNVFLCFLFDYSQPVNGGETWPTADGEAARAIIVCQAIIQRRWQKRGPVEKTQSTKTELYYPLDSEDLGNQQAARFEMSKLICSLLQFQSSRKSTATELGLSQLTFYTWLISSPPPQYLMMMMA